MKISVVTICWNDLAGLKLTIESLRRQSSTDFEQIIIDGGSTDGTPEFLRTLSTPWTMRFVSEKDRGIYDAMNKGTRLANGEYVWFLNSGDQAENPEVVARLNQELQRHPETDLLYGTSFYASHFGQRPVGREVTAKDFVIGMPICHQSCLYRRERLGEAPYSLEYRIISDWVLTQNFFRRGWKTHFINFPVSVFDLSGISTQSHWRIVREKIRYEKSLTDRAKVILLLGGKFALLATLKKVGVYDLLKRRQHREMKTP